MAASKSTSNANTGNATTNLVEVAGDYCADSLRPQTMLLPYQHEGCILLKNVRKAICCQMPRAAVDG